MGPGEQLQVAMAEAFALVVGTRTPLLVFDPLLLVFDPLLILLATYKSRAYARSIESLESRLLQLQLRTSSSAVAHSSCPPTRDEKSN